MCVCWPIWILEYLSILFCAVLWAAAPDLVAVLPMWDSAYVSGTATSQAIGFPMAHGRRVVPSGRLLSSGFIQHQADWRFNCWRLGSLDRSPQDVIQITVTLLPGSSVCSAVCWSWGWRIATTTVLAWVGLPACTLGENLGYSAAVLATVAMTSEAYRRSVSVQFSDVGIDRDHTRRLVSVRGLGAPVADAEGRRVGRDVVQSSTGQTRRRVTGCARRRHRRPRRRFSGRPASHHGLVCCWRREGLDQRWNKPWSRKKGTTVSYMNKYFNMQCNLTKFTALIVNEYCHRCYLFNLCNLH